MNTPRSLTLTSPPDSTTDAQVRASLQHELYTLTTAAGTDALLSLSRNFLDAAAAALADANNFEARDILTAAADHIHIHLES